MIIYPAIDLYDGKAVRLFKGDYAQMTVYSNNPPEIAEAFIKAGARRIHTVDLEGAKEGSTPNFDTVLAIKAAADAAASLADGSRAFVEIGGGIRDDETVAKYLDAGIDRVILGTAAVNDPAFLERCVSRYGERIAVGIDVRDGFVAVKGWTELSQYRLEEFAQSTNRELYRQLSENLDIDIVASGGVSAIEDVEALAALGIHGAIIGKAYYTGAIDLAEAVEKGAAK